MSEQYHNGVLFRTPLSVLKFGGGYSPFDFQEGLPCAEELKGVGEARTRTLNFKT